MGTRIIEDEFPPSSTLNARGGCVARREHEQRLLPKNKMKKQARARTRGKEWVVDGASTRCYLLRWGDAINF